MPPSALARQAPGIRQWLEEHRQDLEDRSGTWTEGNWYGYSRRQNLEKFAEPKILVPYMIDQLCAHYDIEGHYFVNVSTGGYGVGLSTDYDLDPLYVTALLNSQLLSWVLRRYSRAWRGDWFGARKGNLERLPITLVDRAVQSTIVDQYRHCQRLTREASQGRADSRDELVPRLLASAVDSFDRAVFALYGLSTEEISLIRSGAAPVVPVEQPNVA